MKSPDNFMIPIPKKCQTTTKDCMISGRARLIPPIKNKLLIERKSKALQRVSSPTQSSLSDYNYLYQVNCKSPTSGFNQMLKENQEITNLLKRSNNKGSQSPSRRLSTYMRDQEFQSLFFKSLQDDKKSTTGSPFKKQRASSLAFLDNVKPRVYDNIPRGRDQAFLTQVQENALGQLPAGFLKPHTAKILPTCPLKNIKKRQSIISSEFTSKQYKCNNPYGIYPGDSAHQIAEKLHKFLGNRGNIPEMLRRYKAERLNCNPKMKKVVRCQMNFTKINKKFKAQEEILNEKKQFNPQQKEIRRQKAIQDFIKLYEQYLCIDQQKVSPAQIERQKLKMTKSSQVFFQNAEQTDQKLLKDCAQVQKLIDYKNPFLRQIQSEIVLQQKEMVDQINFRRQIRTPSSQRQKNRLLSKGNKNLKQAGSVSRSSVQFRRLINQQARKILPSFKGLKKILQEQFSDQTSSKQAQKRLNETNLLSVMDSNIVPRKGSDLQQMRNQIRKFVKQGRGVQQFTGHISVPVSPVSRKVQMNLNKIYSNCQGQLVDIRGLYDQFDDFEKQMEQTSQQQKVKVVNAYLDPFADWLKKQKKSNPFTQMKGRFMEKYG